MNDAVPLNGGSHNSQVYRLTYLVPERAHPEYDTGWPGGEVIRDDEDNPVWSAPVVRYYMTHRGLQAKIKRVLDPSNDYDWEECAGRVVKVETATVGEWQEVAT